MQYDGDGTEFLFLSTPSARRATSASTSWSTPSRFLSTPSARRATGKRILTSTSGTISIHALREEGDFCCHVHPPFYQGISIHALREEGDRASSTTLTLSPRFLSTPSARRATDEVEGDPFANADFYPRPPRGGRRNMMNVNQFYSEFLSTPSARRATSPRLKQRQQTDISIHALREEGDDYFHNADSGIHLISIHALREEGDGRAGQQHGVCA